MESSSIFLSAGDPSGDTASARLVENLTRLKPEAEFFGLGGRQLRGLGQRQLADPDDLAVLGFWEVAKRYTFFRQLFFRCISEIEKTRPQVVVLVDYPGFNLRLAKKIKKLGIPIIYYISPQIWAWGKRRIKIIRELVDLMLVILPFEKNFYGPTGINHEFVGHYLLEDIPREYIASPVSDNMPPTLALLPGSRAQEIERMLPVMLQTARLFHDKHGARAVVAGVKGKFNYERFMRDSDQENISVSFEDSRKIIHDSNLVLTASGTATLETAIIGRPMVVVYKTGMLTYQIAKRLVRLDKIALANLVLGEKVVPELIQHEASPANMLVELERYVDDKDYRRDVVSKLNRVPGLLGGEGASERAAKLIAQYLD